MPTHGALSKAGKTRSITGFAKKQKKGKSNPRVSNRRKYTNRIVLGRNAGRIGTQGGQYQPSTGRWGHRRRR